MRAGQDRLHCRVYETKLRRIAVHRAQAGSPASAGSGKEGSARKAVSRRTVAIVRMSPRPLPFLEIDVSSIGEPELVFTRVIFRFEFGVARIGREKLRFFWRRAPRHAPRTVCPAAVKSYGVWRAGAGDWTLERAEERRRRRAPGLRDRGEGPFRETPHRTAPRSLGLARQA